jgi:hypothetical protein
MKIFGNTLKVLFFGFMVWVAYYYGMPRTSFNFADIFTTVFLLGILGAVLFLPFVAMNDYRRRNANFAPTILFGVITGIALIGLIIGGLNGSIMFNEGWYEPKSDKFYALLGDINDSCQITSDVSPIDLEHIVVMDESVALRLAEKRLTEYDKSLGSQTDLRSACQMSVKLPEGDVMFYVVPIEHTSFWKWYYNKTVPGYILVNAQNDKDVRMITEANGVKLNMKYIPSAGWGDKLTRYLYRNGYSGYGLTDYTLEVDDNLYPYYVVTIYENTIGYNGENATGLLLVDPVTGDIEEYSIEDAPKWIDRIQPISFIEQQIEWWGKFVHGHWANWSGRDQLAPTPGSSIVYGNDGDCYIYTGVTSRGADNASAGFFLVNSRNKEARYYQLTGATEQAAMNSAAGAIPEKNYNVTQPRPYNINNEFTYLMAHKDAEGVIKMISFVSYVNYEIVGIGENMRTAWSNYNSKMREKNHMIRSKSTGLYDVMGVVSRINIIGDVTYFMIDDFDRILVVPNNITSEIFLTSINDPIQVKFENSTNNEVYVDYFDNLDIVNDTATSTIIKYNENFEKGLKTGRYAKDFDMRYKKMSEAEKYEVKGVKTNTSRNPDDVEISDKKKAELENEYKKK